MDKSIFVELEIGDSLLIGALDESFMVIAFDTNHFPGKY